MRTIDFIAPTGTPLKIADIDPSANMAYIQNNDNTNFMVFGFESGVTLVNGMKVRPDSEIPLPLDGNTSELFVKADTGVVAGVLYIG